MSKNKKINFKDLKDKWYKKLEKSGFTDIEKTEDELFNWDSVRFTRIAPVDLKNTANYYQLAEEFLDQHNFVNGIEKTIWEYHSNGLSIRSIAATLKRARVRSIATDKSTVGRVVKRLKRLMFTYRHLREFETTNEC